MVFHKDKHKAGVPLLPILSEIGSAPQRLAKLQQQKNLHTVSWNN